LLKKAKGSITNMRKCHRSKKNQEKTTNKELLHNQKKGKMPLNSKKIPLDGEKKMP